MEIILTHYPLETSIARQPARGYIIERVAYERGSPYSVRLSPRLHRQVLRNYSGPYALGVTRLNNDDRSAALRLRVENGLPQDFPREIDIDGEQVPVLVDVNWAAPKPLNAKTPCQ